MCWYYASGVHVFMLSKYTLRYVDEVLVVSPSFLFSLLLVLDRMCGPYSKRRRIIYVIRYTYDCGCTCCYNHALILVAVSGLYTLIGLTAISSTSTDPPCHNQRKLSYVSGTPLRPPLLYVGLSHIHMHVRIHACQPTHIAPACLVYVCMADRSWHSACKVYARQDIVASFRAGLGRVGLPRTRFRIRVWHRANGRGDTAVLRLSHGCLDTLCVGPLGQFKSSCMIFLSLFLLFLCVRYAMADHSTNFQVDWTTSSSVLFLALLCSIFRVNIFGLAICSKICLS